MRLAVPIVIIMVAPALKGLMVPLPTKNVMEAVLKLVPRKMEDHEDPQRKQKRNVRRAKRSNLMGGSAAQASFQ